MRYVVVVLVRHILRQFHGRLTYPHCSWTSLLGSLPVLSAHSFASNWQLPFLNQRKGENGCRNFITKHYERLLPDVRIEPSTVRITGGRGSDRATVPDSLMRSRIIRNRSLLWPLICKHCIHLACVCVLLMFPCFLLFVLSLGMLWSINVTFPDHLLDY